MTGLSSYLCFGKYEGWWFGRDGPGLRLVLGWVSFAVMLSDLERDLKDLKTTMELATAEIIMLKNPDSIRKPDPEIEKRINELLEDVEV